MTIMNDASASMTLGELNKNISDLGKQLKKVSSGMRINGAGDGPSEYSISEKMRVRIRALDQDERNVQNGAALLRVAEGAIQQQIEIMKTIKQKVIDADNDTNTDADRLIIQKEINQGYQQIEDIAQETNYNTKRLLVGDTVADVVRSWIVTDTPVFMPDSDLLELIPDNYANDPFVSNDGTKYDKFSEWSDSSTPVSTMALAAMNDFDHGGVTTKPRIMTVDLGTCNLSDLNNNGTGIGFCVTQCDASSNTVTKKYFVITQDASATYNVVTGSNESTAATKIVVNSGMSKEAIADAMVSAINANTTSTLLCAERDGTKVKLTTQSGYANANFANRCDITGFMCAENPAYQLYYNETYYEDSTNKTWGYLSGGRYATGPTPSNPDAIEKPAAPDVLTGNVASVPNGSYIRVSGTGGSVPISFVDGDGGYSGGKVGKNYNGTFTVSGVTVTMDGSGGISFSAPYAGGYTSRVIDGSATKTRQVNTGTVAVKEMKSLTADIHAAYKLDQPASDTDKKRAYCMFDLSSYASATDLDTLNAFINDLKGKEMRWHYRTNETYTYYTDDSYYGFVDKQSDNISDTMGGQYRNRNLDAQICSENTMTLLDLGEMRSKVDGTKTVAEIVAEWMKGKFGSRVLTHSDDESVPATEVRFQAYLNGPAGNSDKLMFSKGNWRKYEIDFTAGLSGKSIPEELDGKGFRFYCATHHGQWFNFEFLNGNLDDKPLSGTDTSDIKTILIDVSKVTDAKSLVNAIYDQAMPKLAGGDGYWDHYLRLASDNNGKLTLYDKRARNVHTYEFEYQVDGAKLADGIIDNVIRGKRNIYVKDLVIHHTDHASQNIHVRIPQTSMDHLFGYVAGEKEFSEFNVLSSASREKLLGNQAGKTRRGEVIFEEEKGYLDTALDYLTSANTLIGAQIMRLEMTQANIVTSRESTTNSESTIRDADMAKEMTGYTKANVLAQAAQSMLAQANQNSSGILSLLQ